MTATTMLALSVATAAVAFCFVPVLSRPDIFFGNTVPRDLRRDPIGRATLRRYRAFVLTVAVIALLAAMATSAAYAIVPAFYFLSTAAWIWAHRTIRPYAVAPATVRTASLAPRDTSYPGGVPAVIGPFLILGFGALLLYLNWDAIPDEIAYRGRGSGSPSPKTIRSVFGVFPFAAAIVAATQIQTWSLLRRTRQIAATGPSAEAEWRFKRRNVQHGVLASHVMAVLFSYIATRQVLTPDGSLGWGFWLIFGVICVIGAGYGMWMMFVGQGGQRRVPIDEGAPVLGDASPDRAWKAGIFYFNPDDPAIFVEKRMGLGWTMNFGNKWAWLFMFAALGVPFLVMLLMRS